MDTQVILLDGISLEESERQALVIYMIKRRVVIKSIE
jgi:hypothetical protein